MKFQWTHLGLLLGITLLSGVHAGAATLTGCTPAYCAIPENALYQLPFVAVAGDVVITEPDLTTVSDVFRIFNNVINTGGGTGLGNLVFLYSSDDSTPLPSASSYSANVAHLVESPSGYTPYTNNGDSYLLGVPEPSSFGLLALGIAGLAYCARRRTRAVAASAWLVLCGPAFTQSVDLPPGPPFGYSWNRVLNGPPQQPGTGGIVTTHASGLSFFTGYYFSLGGYPLPFNIVGSDPALGANTTTIPTVLVPLKFIFPQITGNPSPTLDGTNVVAAVTNSPIFQKTDYTAGSIDLGTTQFGDALQRAQFWNLPGFSPDYHVLLGAPAVDRTITVFVPPGQGVAYSYSPLVGVVNANFFDSVLNALIGSYSAHDLPIFLADNVYLSFTGDLTGCCIIGYHASQSGPISTAKTWVFASYIEPGFFLNTSLLDVYALSHEVSEWLNDPFPGAYPGVNLIPPATLPNQPGSCIIDFETGDPLEALDDSVFTKVTNGTTYHLQDEVLLPWYLHSTPSFSVNGAYTFQNTTGELKINAPPAIAGIQSNVATLPFAPITSDVTGDVVYIGRGCPADSVSPGFPADPYLADPKGKIALIDRGVCGVSLKVDAAAKAGAIGVLIGLVAPGNAVGFIYTGGSTFVPSLVITQATSNAIKNALLSQRVNATIMTQMFSTLCGPG